MGGLIVKRIDVVDVEVKVGLWLVDTASNSHPDWVSVNNLFGRTCGAGFRDGIHLQHGQMMSSMSTSTSSLVAAVDHEVANCKYMERVDMGGVDIHIINLIGEAWVTNQGIATLRQ